MDGFTNAQKAKMDEAELKKKLEGLDSDNLPTANIMVAGITGTGKSTLLNAVFGAELAATGKGRPVTEEIDEYQSDDVPIHIWDTVGLELDSEKTKESINSIRETIAKKAESEDQFDRVHAIWYCINSGSNRYQGAELEFIKSLHAIGVPFIIVLTQCIGEPEEVNTFESQIREMNKTMGMDNIDIVQVCAQDFKLRGCTVPAFGLNKLVEITLEKLPAFIQDGFIAAQKVSKTQKRILAEEIIYTYVLAAKQGFWDKVPLINIFAANNKIMNMFKKIGVTYNTVLPEESVKEIREKGNINFENAFWGLISPIDMGYSKKVANLLDKKKEEGFEVKYESFDKSEKVARLIAFYGYVFISSIEELWEDLTEEQLKDIQIVTRNLIGIINEKLRQRQQEMNK